MCVGSCGRTVDQLSPICWLWADWILVTVTVHHSECLDVIYITIPRQLADFNMTLVRLYLTLLDFSFSQSVMLGSRVCGWGLDTEQSFRMTHQWCDINKENARPCVMHLDHGNAQWFDYTHTCIIQIPWGQKAIDDGFPWENLCLDNTIFRHKSASWGTIALLDSDSSWLPSGDNTRDETLVSFLSTCLPPLILYPIPE